MPIPLPEELLLPAEPELSPAEPCASAELLADPDRLDFMPALAG